MRANSNFDHIGLVGRALVSRVTYPTMGLSIQLVSGAINRRHGVETHTFGKINEIKLVGR